MELSIIREKMKGRVPGTIGERKEYAVLIPLVETDDGLSFLFEKRAGGIKQPGDVCFPGGRMEAGETIEECAVRETAEEIGISSENIEILGQFDSILEANRITMHTVLGVLKPGAVEKAKLNSDEVAGIFTVPVDFFKETEPIVYKGNVIQDVRDFPYDETGINPNYKWRVGRQEISIYHYKDKIIWGLTAGIVRWFIKEMDC